jgi:predicted NBD/HSP70 family sugar kinase
VILRLLSADGPLSRRHISRRTGIQDSTVTYIMRDLLEIELVRTAGKQASDGVGRKHLLLEINPSYGWTIGVSLLHNNAAHFILLNSGEEVIDHIVWPLAVSPEDLPLRLHQAVNEWLNRRGRPPGKFLGLGLGLPGIVDVERGVVLRSRRFSFENYPLAGLLEEQFEAPILVEHNTSVAAYAERRFGCARDLSHFVFFMMNRTADRNGQAYYSFGSSLYLGGNVYRGAHFAAGELNKNIAPDIFLTPDEAEALAASLLDEAGPSTPLLLGLADLLGHHLSAVADLLDPQAIVLSGERPIRNRAFLSRIEDSLSDNLIPVEARAIQVLASRLGERAVACGAALKMSEIRLYGTELVSSGKKKRQVLAPSN